MNKRKIKSKSKGWGIYVFDVPLQCYKAGKTEGFCMFWALQEPLHDVQSATSPVKPSGDWGADRLHAGKCGLELMFFE